MCSLTIECVVFIGPGMTLSKKKTQAKLKRSKSTCKPGHVSYSVVLSNGVSIYLSVCLSVYMSIDLYVCKLVQI